METRTITIKSFEKTSGTKKDQTEWHRISIKATDGKFYSSFKPVRISVKIKACVRRHEA